MATPTRRCAHSMHSHTQERKAGEEPAPHCLPTCSAWCSVSLCVPPATSSRTPRQQKVVIPKMPWKEWACELPHCYVIAILPPPRGIVPVSLTRLATLICIPTPSCVRRPLPYWGANPRFKEVNQSPTSARETESALPYCPF